MSQTYGRPFAWAASITLAALIGSAYAQTDAPAGAAKSRKQASSTTTIVVTNSRAVVLTELDATPTGLFLPKKIASNIPPGKKASVSVAVDKDCTFDLHGIYADGSNTDSTSVNLCTDRTVNLVD
jgi:hypothetical protein